MNKTLCLAMAAAIGFIFGINVVLASACTPPYTCEVHCSGWPTAEERQVCTAACIRNNSEAEWNDNYQGCLAREAREAEQAAARQQADLQAQQQMAAQAEAQRQAAAQRQADSQAQQQAQRQTTPEPTTANPSATTPPEGTPAGLTTQYLGPQDFKVGKTVSTPSDQTANITTPTQKIDLKPGSILKYLDKLTLQLVSGVAHIVEKLEKVAIAGRYKVRVNHAAVSVRGTQYTVDASVPDKTIITVTKGTVNVAPTAKGKKAVDVKEGYQLTVTNKGSSKPVKINPASIDTWYESVEPGPAWINASWSKEASANRYRRECVITAGAAVATQTLTADEQKFVEGLNQGLAVYRTKTVDAVMEKEKKYFSTKERINIDGTKAMQLYFDAKGAYYPGAKAGTWKKFSNKALADNLFKIARQENLTYIFDKNTLAFDGWAGTGKNRLAVYSVALTSAGTDDVISTATGQNQEPGQPVGTATIYVDEESQLWNKADLTINVQSGKVTFPFYEHCQLTYGDPVKVVLPAKAQSVNAKTGLEELNKAISSVR